MTDVLYKAVASIALMPLVAALFRMMVAASGDSVLADQDILLFFLGPLGWVSLVAVGALWLGVMALELTALMAIVATTDPHRLGLLAPLQFAWMNAWPVIRVTARVVAFTLLTVAPFLALAAVAYLTLLTKYDINFYLKEKPPVFFVAIGVGAVLGVTLLAVLLRLFAGWLFALPLVLFEGVSPSDALRVSRKRAHGHRRTLLLWVIGWILVTGLLSALATALVVGLARLFIPHADGSLGILLTAIGASLLLWVVVNLAVSVFSTTTFAPLYFNLYRHLGSDERREAPRLDFAETSRDDVRFQLTRARLLALGTVGIVVAFAVGVFAIHSIRLEDDVEIIAHRGSSKAAPENTMAAVNKAIEEGADWVEIDVQETADGQVVVFHDSDFMKLAGVNLKIWDATIADLKDLDIGSWFGAEFKEERVPTLGEVLSACKARIGVIIELKYYGHDERLEQRVVDIVEAHDMASHVAVMSLKADAVNKMRALRPDWKLGQLLSVSAGKLQSVEADFLAVNARFADRNSIRTARRSSKDIYVWTVNDAATMSIMIGRGVDGLITDKPALARSVLQQRAVLSPPERLLLELAGVFGVASEIGEQ